ncbi:MAG: A/G-specific adenine glycosylase [Clostridia bacterium]|nr:A/G-specific adenine glycosylase [Clostridia bacterium]
MKNAPVQPLSAAVAPLCDWYEANRRALPWREDATPYRVWVSEIMLQQTRIEAVLGYFERFMRECPTVEALAACDPDRLMKLWEGLGYYSRARNLQKAAKEIVAEHGGELPADYEALKRLPGIGDYTAGAIASIAFRIPVPAVDGNVLRVLARLTACDKDVTAMKTRKELTALAASLVPENRPDVFNQALMELGERVCVPNTMPYCDKCPVHAFCAVAGMEAAASLPVRAAKKPRRIEEKTVLVLLSDEQPRRVLLRRREETGLLAGLWELPSVQGDAPPSVPIEGMETVGEWTALSDSRHIFSHIEWHMKGRLVTVKPCAVQPPYEWVDAKALATDRALPTAFRAYAQMLPLWLSPNNEEKGE